MDKTKKNVPLQMEYITVPVHNIHHMGGIDSYKCHYKKK